MLRRKTYNTQEEKIGDFAIGFVGWFVMNLLLWCLLSFGIGILLIPLSGPTTATGGVQQWVGALLTFGIYCVPLLVNIGLVLYFALTRHWIALGALSAFAGLLLAILCLSVIVAVICFAALPATIR